MYSISGYNFVDNRALDACVAHGPYPLLIIIIQTFVSTSKHGRPWSRDARRRVELCVLYIFVCLFRLLLLLMKERERETERELGIFRGRSVSALLVPACTHYLFDMPCHAMPWHVFTGQKHAHAIENIYTFLFAFRRQCWYCFCCCSYQLKFVDRHFRHAKSAKIQLDTKQQTKSKQCVNFFFVYMLMLNA